MHQQHQHRRNDGKETSEDQYIGVHANPDDEASIRRKTSICVTALFLASAILPIVGGGTPPASQALAPQPAMAAEVSRDEVRKPITTKDPSGPSQSVSNDGTWSIGDGEEAVGKNIIDLAVSQQNVVAARSELKATIDGFKDLKAEDWTDDSWKAFDDKRNHANDVANDQTVPGQDKDANNKQAGDIRNMENDLKNLRSALKDRPKPPPALAGGPTSGGTVTTASGDIQAWAHDEVLRRGWSEGDFTDLVWLWNRESGWNMHAANPSGAYGIPQCLGHAECQTDDYRNNWKTQVNWGLNYIAKRYGSPSAAAAQSRSSGWY